MRKRAPSMTCVGDLLAFVGDTGVCACVDAYVSAFEMARAIEENES